MLRRLAVEVVTRCAVDIYEFGNHINIDIEFCDFH